MYIKNILFEFQRNIDEIDFSNVRNTINEGFFKFVSTKLNELESDKYDLKKASIILSDVTNEFGKISNSDKSNLIIFKAFCGAFFKWLNAFIEYLPSGASNMYQNFLKKSVDVEVPENFKYIMYERFQESLDEYDSIIKSDLEKLTQFLVSNNLTTELSFELDQFYLKNQVKVSKEALEESGPKDYVREEKGGCLGVIVLLIIVTILISFG